MCLLVSNKVSDQTSNGHIQHGNFTHGNAIERAW